MKRAVTALLGLCLLLLGLAAAAQQASDLIAQGDAAFDRWSQPFNFTAYQQKLQLAIVLWERALPLLPAGETQTEAHVLNRLAQAYFEMGEAYLTAPDEREAAYKTGSNYALESLRLDPNFQTVEASDGFRAALSAANDVEAIFWYGNTVGKWYDYHQIQAIFSGVLDVLASYERAVELDETYFGGAPQRSLAALIAQAYFVIGKSRDECVPHYKRAIEIAPDYLESYVSYAEFYATPLKMNDLADSLLATLNQLAANPQAVAKWPFYNELAIRRAASLGS
jgi:tetratricopeptide (TPR) repeat protein